MRYILIPLAPYDDVHGYRSTVEFDINDLMIVHGAAAIVANVLGPIHNLFEGCVNTTLSELSERLQYPDNGMLDIGPSYQAMATFGNDDYLVAIMQMPLCC